MKSRPYLLFVRFGNLADFFGDWETLQEAMLYVQNMTMKPDASTIRSKTELWIWNKESDVWINETKE